MGTSKDILNEQIWDIESKYKKALKEKRKMKSILKSTYHYLDAKPCLDMTEEFLFNSIVELFKKEINK